MSEKREIFRAVFPPDEQKAFFDRLKLDAKTQSELATILRVHKRTIQDWARGRFRPPWDALQAICQYLHIKTPSAAEPIPESQLRSIAGQSGGYARARKYGSPGTPEGRRKGGRVSQQRRRKNPNQSIRLSGSRKTIARPERSDDLAEFTGIVLGDGGVTHRQVIISLGTETDSDYADFVAELGAELFQIEAARIYRKNSKTVNVVFSSTTLVDFLLEQGLRIGNKVAQQIDIPGWIFSDAKFARACLRGLIDTDGCVFQHRYRVNKKWYEYTKIGFTNHSLALLRGVERILRILQFQPRNDGVKHVWLDRQADVQRYFGLVGSHNPKHWRRYHHASVAEIEKI